MITVKSAREIDLMREAGRIVALTHQELQKHLKPGISTLELDEIAEKTIRSYGATPSFKGYGGFPGSICASINEVVVHGIPKKNIILHDGDIIALDIGACYKGYHGDSAWSYVRHHHGKRQERHRRQHLLLHGHQPNQQCSTYLFHNQSIALNHFYFNTRIQQKRLAQ